MTQDLIVILSSSHRHLIVAVIVPIEFSTIALRSEVADAVLGVFGYMNLPAQL